jgi:hypothetical protein
MRPLKTMWYRNIYIDIPFSADAAIAAKSRNDMTHQTNIWIIQGAFAGWLVAPDNH